MDKSPSTEPDISRATPTSARGVPSYCTMDLAVAALIFGIGALGVYDSYRLGAGWGSDGPKAGYFPFRIGVMQLTMEPIGPCKIRYTYDGPMELRKQSKVAQDGVGTGPSVRVEMDFTFSSKLPIWDMHANDTHGDEGDLMFPGGHMEQLGGVSGTVKFNGETITIKDSPTIRDHSRGVRDFIRHHFHLWINCQFPSGWGFCGFRANVRGQSEPAMNTAALMKDGKVIPAMLETNGQTVPGSDIWQPFEVTLKPEGMKPIHIKVVRLWQCYHIGMYDPADVYWGAPACADDPKATWSMEQAMEVRVDGETGFGHLERCNRDIVVDDHWRSMCVPGKMDR